MAIPYFEVVTATTLSSSGSGCTWWRCSTDGIFVAATGLQFMATVAAVVEAAMSHAGPHPYNGWSYLLVELFK